MLFQIKKEKRNWIVQYENSLKKDTPHSELRLRTELNQNTSNSGQRNLFHMIESTNTVRPELRIIS